MCAVYRIPEARDRDITRYYPKAPYVETKKCKAFGCKNRRSVSFPTIKNNPYCTDHSKQVYFAAQKWMHPDVQARAQKQAEPPTNVVAYIWRKIRGK